jgi:hypothetical protein
MVDHVERQRSGREDCMEETALRVQAAERTPGAVGASEIAASIGESIDSAIQLG